VKTLTPAPYRAKRDRQPHRGNTRPETYLVLLYSVEAIGAVGAAVGAIVGAGGGVVQLGT